MKLTPKQQHEKNAAIILGKDWKEPEQEGQHETQAKAILDARGPKKQDLTKLKKADLQALCEANNVEFAEEDTKAILIQKLEE